MAKHAGAEKSSHRGLKVAAVILLVVAVLVGACAAILIVRPSFAQPYLQALGLASETPKATSAAVVTQASDRDLTEEELAQAQAQKQKATPLIARCKDVDLRSSIAPADITGILFHQASYEYALILETELPEAEYERVANERDMRVNRNQTEGEWLDAEALHVWRSGDDTQMDTSIDLGAYPGTTILSPVSGTVVLVRDYQLYEETPDVEIHIQPDGRPDLDVVLIHTTDPTVKAGDRVQAGITPVAKVRDIEAVLTDVQLSFFLPEGVGGNHVHIQVNDADYPKYREERLKGAITVK